MAVCHSTCRTTFATAFAESYYRDTFASLMGHTDLTNHLAICENESKARVKFNMLEKMLQPCGPPPEKKNED